MLVQKDALVQPQLPKHFYKFRTADVVPEHPLRQRVLWQSEFYLFLGACHSRPLAVGNQACGIYQFFEKFNNFNEFFFFLRQFPQHHENGFYICLHINFGFAFADRHEVAAHTTFSSKAFHQNNQMPKNKRVGRIQEITSRARWLSITCCILLDIFEVIGQFGVYAIGNKMTY